PQRQRDTGEPEQGKCVCYTQFSVAQPCRQPLRRSAAPPPSTSAPAFLVDVEQTSHHPRRRRAPRNSATLVDVEPLGERQRPGQRRATSVKPYHPRLGATSEPDQFNS